MKIASFSHKEEVKDNRVPLIYVFPFYWHQNGKNLKELWKLSPGLVLISSVDHTDQQGAFKTFMSAVITPF